MQVSLYVWYVSMCALRVCQCMCVVIYACARVVCAPVCPEEIGYPSLKDQWDSWAGSLTQPSQGWQLEPGLAWLSPGS